MVVTLYKIYSVNLVCIKMYSMTVSKNNILQIIAQFIVFASVCTKSWKTPWKKYIKTSNLHMNCYREFHDYQCLVSCQSNELQRILGGFQGISSELRYMIFRYLGSHSGFSRSGKCISVANVQPFVRDFMEMQHEARHQCHGCAVWWRDLKIKVS